MRPGATQHAEPLGDDWLVEAEVIDQDGVAVISWLTIKPRHSQRNGKIRRETFVVEEEPPEDAYIPPGGLTRRLIRELPLTPLLERAITPSGLWSGMPGLKLRTPRHGSRLRDRELAQVAVRYDKLVAAGSITPIKDLLLDGDVGYTEAGLSDLVHKARKHGFLSKAPPGRAGGQATAKARRALES